MDKKRLALASALLELASDHFSNHVCNDMDFPPDWSDDDKRALTKDIELWDRGDLNDYDPDHLFPPDFLVMGFLAHELTTILCA